MIAWWWLLIACPVSFYVGYVYSNWRWTRLIARVSKPSPYGDDKR
jgi:hypothetical protein